MRRITIGFVALVAIATTAPAQTTRIRPEIRPFAGVYVPTGPLRDEFEAATMVGTQVALELSDFAHVLGSVGWTHGHNKYTAFARDLTYLWQYDAGVEFNLMQEFGDGWLLRPLAGVGAGGRTYDYRETGIGRNTVAMAYGALGVELEKGIIAFRLEGRDYVGRFESPMNGLKKTRNDMAFTFGLAYHLR